jgi:NAD(P)-dependent dehydrogenase (short-subunit alcohol dehydrogenase family)
MLARGLINQLEAGSGSVVNVSSIARSRVHPFAGSAYATSKAALAALTREMAAHFATRGIRVNAISPGEIDTAMGAEKLIANIPMRRLELYQRRRAAHQWRPACVTTTNLPCL